MSPLKRIRLRSHAASELKANRSMRAREQAVFVLCLVLPMDGPPKLSLRWARCLTTGSVYFVFHCNNQLLLHFSILALGITAWHRARTRASWGARAAEFDRSIFVASMVPCGDTIGTVPRVLPEKQSVIPGGYHQNIWRDQLLRLAQG